MWCSSGRQRHNMLVAVDIGNSTIKFGLFLEPSRSEPLHIKTVPTRKGVPGTDYERFLAEFVTHQVVGKHHRGHTRKRIDAIVSSVVPSVSTAMVSVLKALYGREPFVVNSSTVTGFEMIKAKGMGVDRIANAVAGYNLVKKPVAVVDFGTATTITVVGKKKDLLGGAILPGLELMQGALHEKTAQLPVIELRKPVKALGRSTSASILSGVVYGTAGATEALIKNMEKELGFRLQLVLTGGHAKLMSSFLPPNHAVVPHLIFDGLRLIYLINMSHIP